MDEKLDILVLIIGFTYTRNKISCAFHDIFHVYKYFSKLGYKCHIFTDICDFKFDYSSNIKNYISKDILDFITVLRSKPIWYKNVTNMIELRNLIFTIPVSFRVISYYTGHGTDRGIELPDGDILSYKGLNNLLSSRCLYELNIIMDCCNVNDFDMNYRMIRTHVKSVEKVRFECINHNFTFKYPLVLIITSSDRGEKSVASKTTSLFTQYFLDFLYVNDRRSLSSLVDYVDQNIIGHVDNEQSSKIYSNISRIPIIPSYFFNPYIIEFYHEYSAITFRDIK